MVSASPNLAQRADVVVIGGGVIGLSIARALALKQIGSVLVLERNQLGRESSFAAAGMLAPQAEADIADSFFQLACQSRDLYPALAAQLLEETGIDIELDRTGTLYCALTTQDQEEIERRYNWQHQAGLAVEQLSANEARELEPNLADNLRSALKFPLDTQVENRKLLDALIVANESRGVRLFSNTNAESVTTERGRVTGVKTSKGFVSTRNIVLASGAWTPLIDTENAAPEIRIEPVRGQMICFETQPLLVRHVVYSPRGYLVPRHDGRLLAGSTTEEAGYDKEVTDAGVRSIRAHAIEIAPTLSRLRFVDSWAGLRPRAPDGLPVLGQTGETEGLFFATGHYRNGILLAPVTAQLIADLIADKVVASELQAFAPDRFATVSLN